MPVVSAVTVRMMGGPVLWVVHQQSPRHHRFSTNITQLRLKMDPEGKNSVISDQWLSIVSARIHIRRAQKGEFVLIKKLDISIVRGWSEQLRWFNIGRYTWERAESMLPGDKTFLFIIENNKYLRSSSCTEDTLLGRIGQKPAFMGGKRFTVLWINMISAGF